MTKGLLGICLCVLWLNAACSSVTVPPVFQEATDSVLGSDDTPGTCCVNLAFYECPNGRATARCAGLGLPACMTACNLDQACQERCLANESPNPRDCTRAPARDAECVSGGTGMGTGTAASP